MGNAKLICRPQNRGGLIVLPNEMLPKLIRWYHQSMVRVEGIDSSELVKRRLKVGPKDKLGRAYEGLFQIEQVHTNGNVTIRLNGPVRERINIRRIEPWRS